jgi:nicotinamide phosphoribosyltransferase
MKNNTDTEKATLVDLILKTNRNILGEIDPTITTDSYKFGGHWKMEKAGTQITFSYDEARNGAKFPYTQWVGLQLILKRIRRVTMEDVEKCAILSKFHLGNASHFNYEGWKYIVEEHDGYLPLRIRAVDEGTKVPVGNVMMTIENTDEKCAWLTNYVESFLMQNWYPSNVATQSRIIKEIIDRNYERSSDASPEERAFNSKFLLHDFGLRAATCPEAGAIGGFAHATNGFGSDSVPAFALAVIYYSADPEWLLLSVAATEHSVACPYGLTQEGEMEYIMTMLEQFPDGILSLVGDSADIVRFTKNICAIKEIIIKRWEDGEQPVNRLVIRPDSPRWKGDTPVAQVKWIMDELWLTFGGKINSKGRRVLHPAVGVIYGDGLSLDEIETIYDEMADEYDIYNIVVGQGGGLMQKHNRDTQRKAIKCSAQKRDDVWVDVFKKPLDETKSSKRGRMTLIFDEVNGYQTILIKDLGDREDLLKDRYVNGILYNETTLAEIRILADKPFNYELL